jgi:hypothetical protein
VCKASGLSLCQTGLLDGSCWLPDGGCTPVFSFAQSKHLDAGTTDVRHTAPDGGCTSVYTFAPPKRMDAGATDVRHTTPRSVLPDGLLVARRVMFAGRCCWLPDGGCTPVFSFAQSKHLDAGTTDVRHTAPDGGCTSVYTFALPKRMDAGTTDVRHTTSRAVLPDGSCTSY